jgi:hypothetical protein
MNLTPSDSRKVDHIDKNPLNNQKSNLRVCNNRQNSCNSGLQSNNTSGYTDVYRHNESGKWIATVRYNGQRIYLGGFDDIKEAARAVNVALLQYHGEYACLNVIPED